MVKLGFFILRVAAGGAGHMVFPILGPYVSPVVHNSVLENIISLGRVWGDGKAAPLYSSYPQCKSHLQGGRLALKMNKNVLTISEGRSAEAHNELAGIGSKRLIGIFQGSGKGVPVLNGKLD